MGIVLLSGGVLLGLALASWHAAGGEDWVGPIGARVAEASIALLGTASVLVPWSCVVVSVRLFRRTVRPIRPLRTLGTAGIVAAVATGMHLWLGDWPALGGLPAGGLVGATLGELLRVTVGTAGAFTVVFTALLVALVVRTRLSVVTVAARTRDASVKGAVLALDGGAMLARAWKEARAVDEREAKKRPATPRAPAPEELTAKALRPVLDAPPEPDDEELSDPEGIAYAPTQAVSSAPGPDALMAALTRSATDSEPRPSAPAPAARKGRRKVVAEPVEAPAAPVIVAPAQDENAVAPRPSRTPPSSKAITPEASRTPPASTGLSPEASQTPPASTGLSPEASQTPPASIAISERVEKRNAASTPISVSAERPDFEASEPPVVEAPKPARARPTPAPSRAVVDDVIAIEEPTDGPLNIVSHDHEIERAKKVAPQHHPADPAPPSVPAAVDMVMPSVDMLSKPPPGGVQFDEAHLRATAERLVQTLAASAFHHRQHSPRRRCRQHGRVGHAQGGGDPGRQIAPAGRDPQSGSVGPRRRQADRSLLRAACRSGPPGDQALQRQECGRSG